MSKTDIQVFQKLNLLLALVLCSLFACMMPVTAKATPTFKTAVQTDLSEAADAQLTLFAGDISAGETEGILQIDKTELTQVFQVLLQNLYPHSNLIVALPHSYPASKGDCGLHTILTKGP